VTSHTTITLPSPAKLNLFLHINGRREDGYHELQTLFQFLDHGDSLSLTLTNNNKIDLLTPVAGVSFDDNLIVKAAKILLPFRNNNLGIAIAIDKILPMGGGLGGGSSNAATVLLALNTLWNINLPLEKVADLGLSLGADVPIFVRGFAAFADGVGEQLMPASPLEYWYLVTKPNCNISTAQVFNDKALPRSTAKVDIKDLDIDTCHNDCETVVIKHYPEVANLLSRLIEYAPSRMTGTGACVFTRFTTEKEARNIQSLLPQSIESFVAKGLNQSPVHAVIEKIAKSTGEKSIMC